MEPTVLPPFSSSPVRAIQSVLSSANWIGNLLWLSLAFLASSIFVGQIALFGYGAELLERRAGRPENPPYDIDSNRLGDYLSKGIWPFLANLVVQLAATVVVSIPIGGLFFASALVGGGLGGEEGLAIGMFMSMPFILVLSIFANMISVPFLIRGMVCQDFVKTLDLGWALGFLRIMFWEMLFSGIVFGLLSFVIVMAGFALLCVGYLPATGLVMGGMMYMTSQWYEIYLSRGGEPAPGPDDNIVDATIV